ncbi:Hypothetical protein Deide_1p00420 (plasmid) [Deinococcus deserti VCD115]|uniref:Uncharacterized protein n=1 Tax=Deinococcus deserti (strain DSM 17065 / CIP 109153 / LMG 22923 / VCD115) TaxID=546414 RepID=C1D203_DEIDV|nr:Hypothetical protein Deide_1p00420 [Deinococcus deserti VCD115]
MSCALHLTPLQSPSLHHHSRDMFTPATFQRRQARLLVPH